MRRYIRRRIQQWMIFPLYFSVPYIWAGLFEKM
jgi:hypothetical protein